MQPFHKSVLSLHFHLHQTSGTPLSSRSRLTCSCICGETVLRLSFKRFFYCVSVVHPTFKILKWFYQMTGFFIVEPIIALVYLNRVSIFNFKNSCFIYMCNGGRGSDLFSLCIDNGTLCFSVITHYCFL